MTEQQLQSKIIKHAKLNGWLYIKTIKLSESGHADLIFFKDGKTIFIEVKNVTGGVKSELQIYRQKQFQNAGFIWEFCNSLEQFKELINDTSRSNKV